MPLFLDLFAGAGGLSEGFIQAGYTPIAHIEMDKAACNTLKTRAAFHWLNDHGNRALYNRYLARDITREEFYRQVPDAVLNTVLNYEISEQTLPVIFNQVDALLNGRHLDIVIGGPPCQAYSIAGRSRSETNMVGDRRNYLYRLYAEFLRRYQPRCFVFENVVGLLSAKEEDGTLHLENMISLFKQCGYTTKYQILTASDYGVLQNRKRVILIGVRGERIREFYPKIRPLHNWYTVNDLLSDLPSLHAGEGIVGPTETLHYSGHYLYRFHIKENDMEPVTFHQARPHTAQDLEIYRLAVEAWNAGHRRLTYLDIPTHLQTHANKTSFLDRFKVVAGDLPSSQTIVAHIARDGHYFIHPDIEQNRSLTPREAARIQTFPDNYYFEAIKDEPSRTVAFKQIGNAVPVQLAYRIAKALLPKFQRRGDQIHE
jgi:DNA (cytosine-5)-methyltransferase 1